MFAMDSVEICQELRQNFIFPPVAAPQDILEKLAEHRRSKITTTTKLKVYLLEVLGDASNDAKL